VGWPLERGEAEGPLDREPAGPLGLRVGEEEPLAGELGREDSRSKRPWEHADAGAGAEEAKGGEYDSLAWY